MLREALAKGADRAIHLEDDKFVQLDSANTARAIAAAVAEENFDLIVTGLQSDDFGARRQACCWRRSSGVRMPPSSSASRRPNPGCT